MKKEKNIAISVNKKKLKKVENKNIKVSWRKEPIEIQIIEKDF